MNVLIVCEGKNDVEFFEKLIKHLSEKGEIQNLEKIEVNFYPCGGKNNVLDVNYKKYKDLKLEIVRTKSILFVVDADYEENDEIHNGFDNTQKMLNKVISELSLKDVKISTYIMCDPKTKTGYLESLILSTISKEQRTCIECFLACSKFESKESHKAILNQIYNMAYPDAPYDFQHPHFDKLKEKLCNLFTTDL